MTYDKKLWQDRIRDAGGNIIQEGTPVSAGNMNHIEQGISDAHAQLDGATRQKQILSHGLSVLNGNNNAPVDIQIEGRTLVSMGTTPLDPMKNYVLAAKHTKLRFANNTYQGVAKFTGENGKPVISRIATFLNKVSASTLESPHISKVSGASSTLLPPSGTFGEISNTEYANMSSLNGVVYTPKTSTSGNIQQQLFSFDIVQEIERQIGRIPRVSLADKVQWCKDNLNSFALSWYGYGSSVGGNKATLKCWDVPSNGYSASSVSHATSVVTKLVYGVGSFVGNKVDANGFIHFLAYAEASDGTTASTINTDYIELEIELKPDAILLDPVVPLYEIPTDEFAKILVDWNEDAVISRYPKVQGTQHLQNPIITAEGENLLPPFYEWSLHANTKVNSPYELELNATAVDQVSETPLVNCLPSQTYTFSSVPSNKWQIDEYTDSGVFYQTVFSSVVANSYTFTTSSGARKLKFRTRNTAATGKLTFSQPMLSLGSVAKPFVPRNPSYMYASVKLGQIGTAKDVLYKQDGDWKINKAIEKDVVLDGSFAWSYYGDNLGFKSFGIPISTLNNPLNNSHFITKYNGLSLIRGSNSPLDSFDKTILNSASSTGMQISVSDSDSGFGETYTPVTAEIQAYFNGWQAKTLDATGKPTAWKNIVDGTDAPTQTLAYVSTTKAANYTPYKLSYILATPVIETVTNKVEGDISVNGQTQVSVDAGVIMREKVKPQISGGYYYVNTLLIPLSWLTYRAAKLLKVYKNGVEDTKWLTENPSNSGNGLSRTRILAADYDTAADYTVTYLILDREKFTANAISVTATFANNIRSAVDDVEKRVEDNTANISIQANVLYDVLKRLKAGGL
ncbi:hypothetical protein ACN6MY_03775 [Peribacillus sp. B-H-3]|uniref:hypothetical protein n=1 Tax=Peribacillus sp. B-H-3 TaxID=3400420 RepID=UPI003B0291DC